VPPLAVDTEPGATLLVLGWGSTEGAIRAGVRRAREQGARVACAQLRHLNPLPANTGEVLRSFDRVLVPELNSGQLAQLLRGRFLVDVESLTKMQGHPLFAAEVKAAVVQRAGALSIGSPAGAELPEERQ
jgi:2-oxoglutarate ferredoxin oxidoreductase subunit alpha